MKVKTLSEELIDLVQYAREEDWKQRYPLTTPNRRDTEHTLQMLWLIRNVDELRKGNGG